MTETEEADSFNCATWYKYLFVVFNAYLVFS